MLDNCSCFIKVSSGDNEPLHESVRESVCWLAFVILLMLGCCTLFAIPPVHSCLWLVYRFTK